LEATKKSLKTNPVLCLISVQVCLVDMQPTADNFQSAVY